ncbi:MAG: hypothetical protein ACPIOQ_68985 [Promethearchaeia archaeon]
MDLEKVSHPKVRDLVICGKSGQEKWFAPPSLSDIPWCPWSGVRASCYLVHSSRQPSPPASGTLPRQRAWTVSSVTPPVLKHTSLGICLRFYMY